MATRLRTLGLVASGATALGASWSVFAAYHNDSPLRQARTAALMTTRAVRDVAAASLVVTDYLSTSWNATDATRHELFQACHQRSAQRLLRLFFDNSGIYIKIGQHIGQLDHLLPKAYVELMREHALDRCPTSSAESVRQTFLQDVGAPPEVLFAHFDPEPFASASLAQVHRAVSHEGEELAIKVQHSGLQETCGADVATIKVLVSTVKFFFPRYDYSWLIEEIESNLPLELDFLAEAENADRCRANFARPSSRYGRFVHVPHVHKDKSSSRILTLEYVRGTSVRDPEGLRQLGVSAREVARLVAGVFNEMVFHFGDVHCDPHPANLLLRRNARSGRLELVLLDHGLYRQLRDDFRRDYAALWSSLVFADAKGIEEHARRMNAGELYPLFAAMLTTRPWDQITRQSTDHLYSPGTDEDAKVIQSYVRQYQQEITELLLRIPRELLLLLKTNDCLRSIDACLGRPLNTLTVTARECNQALSRSRNNLKTIHGRIQHLWSMGAVELRIFLLHVITWWARMRSDI